MKFIKLAFILLIALILNCNLVFAGDEHPPEGDLSTPLPFQLTDLS